MFVGSTQIATTRQTVPAGEEKPIALQLPVNLQRRLAAAGTLDVKTVTLIDIDGSTVRVESTLTLEAPAAQTLAQPRPPGAPTTASSSASCGSRPRRAAS